MELTWTDVPYDGVLCFSRDAYDKYSLAPTMKELWVMTQNSSSETAVKKESPVDASNKNRDCAPTAEPEKASSAAKSDAFPEPMVPFPRFSMLTARQQQTYVRLLMNNKQHEFFQPMQKRVMLETTEFMKYLQDVARVCADDYNYLSSGASRYVEEYLRAGLEKAKNYPQVYLIQEMTSITGGKFNPELSLNFEKQLLTLGRVDTGDFYKALPQDVQLAVAYEAVSAKTPPEKKASLAFTDISSDPNAEKLCARYTPHVCLTSQAFFRLLDNHGPDYQDQWEMPVIVKETSGKDSRKSVYIDSPLVKTEVTMRERNHLFQEESMKLVLNKTGFKKAFELLLDSPEQELVPLFENCSRSLVSFDNTDIDFDTDLADLETFGESSSTSKKTLSQKEAHTPGAGVKLAIPKKRSSSSETPAEGSGKAACTPAVNEADSSRSDTGEASVLDSSLDGPGETDSSLLTETEDSNTHSASLGVNQLALSSPAAKRAKPDLSTDVPSPGDESDEERLVIDTPYSPEDSLVKKPEMEVQSASGAGKAMPPADPIPDTPLSPSNDVTPDTPLSPSNDVTPDTPLSPSNDVTPDTPFSPSNDVTPDTPLSPSNDVTPDTPLSPSNDVTPDTPLSPSNDAIPDTPMSPTPESNKQPCPEATSPNTREKARKATKRATPKVSHDCDQLGQILRMQTALLKPCPDTAHDSVSPPRGGVSQCSPAPQPQSHPQSLVKPCVTSYLEDNEGTAQRPSASAPVSTPTDSQAATQNKRLLSEDLLVSAEDERDYKLPEEGNLLYRLYSLQDVLLMVRSSVPMARFKKIGNTPKMVPVHILPKLEYQLCYGIECLTRHESCQLWAESVLHSSTVSCIGHIDALSSRLFKMEEVSADRIGGTSSGFTPARSLNILHHLLKKVSGLQEGTYLLSHKAGEPFVTILKASNGKKITRATYDLHQAHSTLPQALPHSPAPWVPVDPTHVLPFHIKHGRVPCTFPPHPQNNQARSARCPVTNTGRGGATPARGQPGPAQGPGKKKKKKKAKGKSRVTIAAGNRPGESCDRVQTEPAE